MRQAGAVAYSERDYLELGLVEARAQWRSLVQRPLLARGQRQVAFLPVETLLCLAAMYVVEHSRFGSSSAGRAPEPVQSLARLFRRPPTSILAKMANLDGSRSHGARFDLLASATLRADPEHFSATYRTILMAARQVGVASEALPDFLGIEPGGTLILLGQDELGTPDVESALEAELRRRTREANGLSERDTERVMLTAIRVGQHRFARGVLANCGGECVFCGFSLSAKAGQPSLLRASHIKPWSRSEPRERLAVTNGVAACPTHDAAFDAGLLTLGRDLSIERSTRLVRAMEHNPAVRRAFDTTAIRAALRLPDDALPIGQSFIDFHRTEIFAA